MEIILSHNSQYMEHHTLTGKIMFYIIVVIWSGKSISRVGNSRPKGV